MTDNVHLEAAPVLAALKRHSGQLVADLLVEIATLSAYVEQLTDDNARLRSQLAEKEN